MTSIRVRPRFRHQVEGTAKDINTKLVEGFKKHEDEIHMIFLPHYLVVEYNPDLRHYWSPQLQLSLEENEEGVLVRGLYGPHPNVWSIFFYGYASMGVLSTFLCIIGISQAMVQGQYWAFWAMGACLLIATVLYLIAQFGQKIGAEQTFEIHHIYTDIMGHPEPIH
ncbi:hypothetical protein [Phaeocystidibacter marisrubri]|uniref:Uncharacterized protein n=1 Tax=Phaeocystidibacter marisrubri TaxID=1577780 RepID=A0A6L3ZFN4_9FLAO|nr:hypothetical protein [Phaeocystidibacter marisrubri]KAB2816194.1 hypothetical protein F8C82_10940 [Phaeocystidibacter marisrubri]GGH67790.1 hypothetical protein GCM10011318_07160 [Phaeocystidibacter marisrubri]